jgi:hypothetical protein
MYNPSMLAILETLYKRKTSYFFNIHFRKNQSLKFKIKKNINLITITLHALLDHEINFSFQPFFSQLLLYHESNRFGMKILKKETRYVGLEELIP